MKTEVINSIYFPDGKEKNLCAAFKKIFPKEDLIVNLWDFKLIPKPYGHYRMTLEIEVSLEGDLPQKFIYSKTTSDMPLIDAIKSCETGAEKRKAILIMVGNDTFIEELEEFLGNIIKE